MGPGGMEGGWKGGMEVRNMMVGWINAMGGIRGRWMGWVPWMDKREGCIDRWVSMVQGGGRGECDGRDGWKDR